MSGRPIGSRGFFFARHSQSEYEPSCPQNTSLLWTGYSLLHITGNDHSYGQDLGQAGSCMRLFSSMPFTTCSYDDTCKYAEQNDWSYWLKTSKERPTSQRPINVNDVKPYISRCAVCESETRVVAIHSQTIVAPDCPTNWISLWEGYSFLMVIIKYYSSFDDSY